MSTSCVFLTFGPNVQDFWAFKQKHAPDFEPFKQKRAALVLPGLWVGRGTARLGLKARGAGAFVLKGVEGSPTPVHLCLKRVVPIFLLNVRA